MTAQPLEAFTHFASDSPPELGRAPAGLDTLGPAGPFGESTLVSARSGNTTRVR